MNNSICWSHKKTPYELIYKNKPYENCNLIDELFIKGIYNEKNIPETIKIIDFEELIQNLDDDFDFDIGKKISLFI